MTWVSEDTKARFAAIARHQGLSDSAMLKRLVDLMLRSTDPASYDVSNTADSEVTRSTRLTVRLRPDDETLLRARAAARGMAPATYLSVLTRAHLRSLAPLPKEELLALKRSVSELGSVGRNLNQIARAANQGDRVAGPGREELRAMLRICEALRDHVKGLIAANLKSWEHGYAD
jgi:Bacterial mobilisation protein (MobC)